MTKEEYRQKIRRLSAYVSMKTLLRDLGIQSNLYFLFMKGDDIKLSVERLELILQALPNEPIGRKSE